MQETEKKSKKIKIGLSIQEGIKSAPWAWYDEQTKLLLGFEVDIARAISENLGLIPEFVPLENFRLLVGLINSNCDMIICALKTQNPPARVILSEPYYQLTQKIVTLEENNFNSLEDLQMKKVGVLSKSLGEFIIQNYNLKMSQPIALTLFDDVLDLFSALHFKDIESAFIDSPVALWYSKTYLNTHLRVSDIAYKSGSYSIGFREDSVDLKNQVNKAIKNIDLYNILEKYGLWDDAQKNI